MCCLRSSGIVLRTSFYYFSFVFIFSLFAFLLSCSLIRKCRADLAISAQLAFIHVVQSGRECRLPTRLYICISVSNACFSCVRCVCRCQTSGLFYRTEALLFNRPPLLFPQFFSHLHFSPWPLIIFIPALTTRKETLNSKQCIKGTHISNNRAPLKNGPARSRLKCW